ncbi:hypothetical protein AQI70_20660 [Streptomyces curacoi]|uniref:Uncharacterized protein n=1 Tax=Streptomyces curacoi TaxID=146536 RepID=A0A117P506_9ACTN|nr:hypothetical protein AQI70_20660 [Streptomyces curacoi]
MTAADEVPPYDDLLLERGAAEQDRPRRSVRLVHQRQSVDAGVDIAQLRRTQPGVGHADVPAVHENPVLEVTVQG